MVRRFDITPPGAFNRKVGGRSLFSPLVVVQGNDHAHIYVAGKTSIGPDGMVRAVGDLRRQLALVCEGIGESLGYVGAALDDVVRTVTYVRDIDAYYGVVDERYKYFSRALPTNTLLAVSRLAHPDMLVEIEAEAIVDPARLRNLPEESR
jgi:enamine deaminase RidA (YjgF/YER057c/UK114 family)